MRAPALKVSCVGETSTWGKQFLSEMQVADIVEVKYEPNVLRFANTLKPTGEQQIVFVENFPESRNWILNLIRSAKPFYIIWFGRVFSKEDMAFAIENRIYAVYENYRFDDKRITASLQRLLLNHEAKTQQDHLIHSLKSRLLQIDPEEDGDELIQELRTGITKLEKCVTHNEFNHEGWAPTANSEERLPFHKTTDFGDALLTVEDLERTGVLWIRGTTPAQEGKVEFLQGKIISAAVGEVSGLKAIYRMFLWDEPKFLFNRKEPKDCTSDQALDMNLKQVCKEGQSQRERFEAIRRELPPAELALTLEPTTFHDDTALPPNDFSTLATLLEFGRVVDIVDYSTLWDVQVYESLIRLKKSNLIRVAAPTIAR